jgi:hypothetical protein
VLSMGVEIQAALPVEERIPEQSHDRAHGSGRNPCGFRSPHRADGGGILDPAHPGFHGEMVRLIGLEYRGICTALCPHSGRQARPARRVGGRPGGWGRAPEAITAGGLGRRCPGGTASLRAFLPLCDRCHLGREGMGTPGPRLAAPPPVAAACVLGQGGRRIGGPGKPAGCDTRAMLCDRRSCLRWGGGSRDRHLGGPWA